MDIFSILGVGTNADYLQTFRMSKVAFQRLCEKLHPSFKEEETIVETQLAVCLLKLGTRPTIHKTAELLGIHKCTVHKYFYRVIKEILKFKNDYLKFPDTEEALQIATEFEEISQMPNVIGSIGATHIPVHGRLIPKNANLGDYINSRYWLSVIMHGVVDNNYKFRHISSVQPGGLSFADAFNNSEMEKNLIDVMPKFAVKLPPNNETVNSILIGTTDQPLLPRLITPFVGSALKAQEQCFNQLLISMHELADDAFLKLKARWQCLLGKLDVHFDNVSQVFTACVILHNYLIEENDAPLESWTDEVLANDDFPQPVERSESFRHLGLGMEGVTVRNNLMEYLFESHL